MMINGRLIGMVPKSKRYVAAGVALQWVGLLANMTMILVVCVVLERLYERTSTLNDLIGAAVAMVLAAAVRAGCAMLVTRMGHLASCEVKRTVRHRIYEKLLALGPSYRERAMTSEVVQVAVEGVDQLETYFGAYLPQLFYALLAPLTLFCVVATISLPAAVVLLVCVPLIPIAIAAVQTWAKRLLGHYWGQYAELGDTFLENLQGLTTLKVYQADGFKQDQMNEQAEKFRRITMRVLTMQLNSITIMDLVAFGGAATGIAVVLMQFQAGAVGLAGCLAVILLAADYFIPMRLLGSFFHVAMNGMAASDKIFRLLDADEPPVGGTSFPARADFLRAGRGLDTPLAERAANLSGGQRQRLAVARALLHETPVYVFDEATSNVDMESEDAIMGAVRDLAGRSSVILISHRLANVTEADQILVLAGGRVVERGRHEELVGTGGTYARLWHAQQELEGYGIDHGADVPAARGAWTGPRMEVLA